MRIILYGYNSNEISSVLPLLRGETVVESFYIDNEDERALYLLHEEIEEFSQKLDISDIKVSDISQMAKYLISMAGSANDEFIGKVNEFAALLENVESDGTFSKDTINSAVELFKELRDAHIGINGLIMSYPCKNSLYESDAVRIKLQASEIQAECEFVSIADYFKYYFSYSPEKYEISCDFEKTGKDEIETLTIGLSYIQRGLNTARLSSKTVCLAAPTQDFFYDFEMAKYALEKADKVRNIIWGISPYSLWYDLSLSANKMRCMYYIPETGTTHNYPKEQAAILIDEYGKLREILEKVFVSDFVRAYYEGFYEGVDYIHNTEVFANDIDESRDRVEVERLFNKNYPETFEENKKIADSLLTYMEERGISVYIVLPPYSSTFRKYMNYDMYDKTISFFEEMKGKHKDITFVNLFDDSRFDDYYFADYSHLNYWGASLMADIMNGIMP